MKHYGDITKLSGYTLPAVDCITGGSPCQDLSVAGKREGLSGKRSGLFMEQVRIIKEMRERDRANGRTGFMVRPRYCVWENVPGAFSSNGGKDFQAVLTEFVKVSAPEADDVPLPENGKWPKSGCIYAEMGGWSIAWRVHDAQFWGVPQRRKRISLVADFGGLSAPEILFEREGLSGDFEPCGEAGQEAAGAAGGRVEGAEPILLESNQNDACIWQNGICNTLPASMGMGGGYVPMVVPIHDKATRYIGGGATRHGDGAGNGLGVGKPGDPMPTLSTGDRHAVYDARGNGDGSTVPTLTGDHQNRVTDYTALCVGNGQLNQMSMAEQANTLDTMHDQQAVMVASVVRRLTPLECERLQGYPDGWTDIGDWVDSQGKKHKAADSPRYKALGNSIALPFWQYLARRICAQYERDITMGSLFDGIGGFPLVFERCGAKAVWASEIEEFPIAVTKKHFPEETP